jgi:hypothetical protein
VNVEEQIESLDKEDPYLHDGEVSLRNDVVPRLNTFLSVTPRAVDQIADLVGGILFSFFNPNPKTISGPVFRGAGQLSVSPLFPHRINSEHMIHPPFGRAIEIDHRYIPVGAAYHFLENLEM